MVPLASPAPGSRGPRLPPLLLPYRARFPHRLEGRLQQEPPRAAIGQEALEDNGQENVPHGRRLRQHACPLLDPRSGLGCSAWRRCVEKQAWFNLGGAAEDVLDGICTRSTCAHVGAAAAVRAARRFSRVRRLGMWANRVASLALPQCHAALLRGRASRASYYAGTPPFPTSKLEVPADAASCSRCASCGTRSAGASRRWPRTRLAPRWNRGRLVAAPCCTCARPTAAESRRSWTWSMLSFLPIASMCRNHAGFSCERSAHGLVGLLAPPLTSCSSWGLPPQGRESSKKD